MESIVPVSIIKHYRDSKSLVSLTRDDIDGASIQGFILDYNEAYILLAYVHDFYVDGYLILRRQDLTSLNCRATDAFQHSLLVDEGLLKQVDFSHRFSDQGILDHLRKLPKKRIIILEDETEDDLFLIGTLDSIDDSLIKLRFFSGAAKWDEDLAQIEIDDVTSISYSTNYTKFYERYYDRKSSMKNTENNS